jgi:hypothetical protein
MEDNMEFYEFPRTGQNYSRLELNWVVRVITCAARHDSAKQNS